MDNEREDRHLWEAVVSAERQVTERRAEFRRDAGSRRQILATALGGSNWDRGSALSFLQSFHDDVPELVDHLVDLALSDSWALPARQILSIDRRDPFQLTVEEAVLKRVAVADAVDFRRLAELLVSLEAWRPLYGLLERARASSDPEVNEVDHDFRKRYGPMMTMQ